MSDDEFDNIPDDFADVEGVDWARLLAGPLPTNSASHASGSSNTRLPPDAGPCPPPGGGDSRPPNSNSNVAGTISRSTSANSSGDTSNYYVEDVIMDPDFLAELEQVEQRAIIRASQGPSTAAGHASSSLNFNTTGLPRATTPSTSNHGASSHVQHTGESSFAPQPQIHNSNEVRSMYFAGAVPCERIDSSSSRQNYGVAELHTSNNVKQPISKKRPCPSPEMSPKRKGKMKAENDIDQILSTYEDELTCPICCDLFVASHVGNPCGHTFCGECGWEWHIKNRNKACPCCRLNFTSSTPLIPNISMDNTVEKHVKALALSGAHEWQQGGRKLNDWLTRKKTWKEGVATRKMTTRRAPATKPWVNIQTYHHINQLDNVIDAWLPRELENEEDDPTYEDSDVELLPRPIVQRLRRGGSRAR